MTTAREATAFLERAGVPNAAYDARALMSHATATNADLKVLLTARATRIPLQHLIGSVGFRYLELAVGPGVFVPRPETELLVDAVLAWVANLASPIVVDLCAGSGAIGLSIAHEHRSAVVHLVERSTDAFSWLELNAAGRDRVQLHHADLAAAPIGLDGAVDIVVSNPPYVPLDERDEVAPEVREHDPAEALWGGADGLDVIRQVVERSVALLRSGGRVVIEHSERHEASVPELLRDAGFVDVRGHLDLTGRPRFSEGATPC